MFSGNRPNKKRTRSDNASTPAQPARKTGPRLPDYLIKHPHADAIRALLIDARDQDCLREVMNIINECQTQKFNLEYLHDWLAIYLFLHNARQVTPYIDRLEDSLQQHAATIKRKKFNVTEEDKLALPTTKRNPYDHMKILSTVLYAWAKENGFRQRAKFVTLLKSSDFMSMLRQKTIFKDSSVTANIHHGAWPHAIQWYCIIEHHKDTPFLLHDPLEVLQSFGDAKQRNTARGSKLPWDMIVDRFDRDMFFTSPYVITEYLTAQDQMDKRPLLGESLKRQEEKSQHKFRDYRGYTKYLADKHDGQCFVIKKL